MHWIAHLFRLFQIFFSHRRSHTPGIHSSPFKTKQYIYYNVPLSAYKMLAELVLHCRFVIGRARGKDELSRFQFSCEIVRYRLFGPTLSVGARHFKSYVTKLFCHVLWDLRCEKETIIVPLYNLYHRPVCIWCIYVQILQFCSAEQKERVGFVSFT